MNSTMVLVSEEEAAANSNDVGTIYRISKEFSGSLKPFNDPVGYIIGRYLTQNDE